MLTYYNHASPHIPYEFIYVSLATPSLPIESAHLLTGPSSSVHPTRSASVRPSFSTRIRPTRTSSRNHPTRTRLPATPVRYYSYMCGFSSSV